MDLPFTRALYPPGGERLERTRQKYPNSGVGFDLRLFDLGSFFVLMRRQEISIGHSRCKRQSGLPGYSTEAHGLSAFRSGSCGLFILLTYSPTQNFLSVSGLGLFVCVSQLAFLSKN
jgi:hypothetical protein